MPDRVRVHAIGHLTTAARALVHVPDELLDAIYEQLQNHVGRESKLGQHVERLLVDGRAVRVNAFVDADGTMWVTAVGTHP